MQLSEKTITILKNFTSINQSLYFRAGSIQKTLAFGSTAFAEAVLDQEFPRDFAIGELAKFINILGICKEPEVFFEEDHLVILNGRQKIKYVYTKPDQVTFPSKDYQLPTTSLAFLLPKETLAQAMKAASILGIEHIAFEGDGESIFIKAVNPKDATSNFFMEELGSTNKKFVGTFDIANLKMLPNDYHVELCPVAAQFKVEGLRYLVAMEAKHTNFAT